VVGYLVVMQRSGAEDVMRYVLRRLVGRVFVLAVARLAIVIDHLPERDHVGSEALRLEVVKGLSHHAHQPFEEVAMRQGPLPPALAAEQAKQLAGFVAQTNLPGDVVARPIGCLGSKHSRGPTA
jgi:hypothetical protein